MDLVHIPSDICSRSEPAVYRMFYEPKPGSDVLVPTRGKCIAVHPPIKP